MNAITAHIVYVIKRIFCQPLKQAFSCFYEEVFSVWLGNEVV